MSVQQECLDELRNIITCSYDVLDNYYMGKMSASKVYYVP